MKRTKLRLAATAVCVVALVTALAACAPTNKSSDLGSTGSDSSATQSTTQTAATPEPDEYGVVVADSWKDIYPSQYATYKENESNSPEGKMNYLEEYPELTTMYKGYGFAKGYDEAASHSYSLQSVSETPRISDKTLANCITCKTPQYTAMVNSEGDSAYSKPFADVISEMTEPISCYNCHENDPTKVVVTQKHFINALGTDAANAPLESEACGQCHNEYYFDSDTKATTNPYTGLEGMDAEAILAYYDELGFSDWEHPDTGAAMLKAQHPEFETIYGGSMPSTMATQGYSCADCHMSTETDSDGNEYSSHNLVSPLESETIMAKCQTCHTDLKSQVEQWQKETTDREHEIAAQIKEYIDLLASKKDSLDADTLAAAQKIQRHAQFYWDFVMVENSEGAHNYKSAAANLDKAEAQLEEGFKLLEA
jgi:nitrite reductase (cytochrome c-552)